MRRLGVITALVAVGLAAGCSTSAEPSDESTPNSVVPSVGHGAFAYCLSQHGVPTPAGPATDPPPDVDPGKWEAAMSECASLAPGPGPT